MNATTDGNIAKYRSKFLTEFFGTALLVFGGLSAVIFMFGTGSPMAELLPNITVRQAITGFLFGTTGASIAISALGKASGAQKLILRMGSLMDFYKVIKIYVQVSELNGDRFIFSVTFFLGVSTMYAQDLEPRAYSNIPMGLNFVVAGYVYSTGGVLFDPTVPLDNANIKVHGTLFAYARSIRIGNMSGKVDVVLPYAWLSGSADYKGDQVFREVNGLGDSRVRMSVNFVGAPALPFSRFKEYKQNFIFGGSLQVQLPTSQYDPARLINIGTNRVTIKPELGISKTFGRLFLEAAAGVALYTTNNDFYNGQTRTQSPISSLQGHIIYTTKTGIWAAFDGTYYWGGKTTVDGVEGNDLQKNSRMGITLALPVNTRHSIKLNYSTGVSIRTGGDFDLVAIAWQYRWSKSLPNNKKVATEIGKN